MPKYTVNTPLRLSDADGKNETRYEPGDTVDLPAKQAAELIAAGALSAQGKAQAKDEQGA